MNMLPGSSRAKPKSPGADLAPNPKTSVTCNNVPEGLFDATAAKKHFSKFGRVQRIRLFPKRQMCIIEYDQPMSAERAVLNAGAFDGFMFDVTRTKQRVRKKSKLEDDPDWVPDADVEEELSAMSGTPIYRLSRQKPMEIDPAKPKLKTIKRVINQSPKKTVFAARKQPIVSQPTTGIEPPVAVTTTQTTLSTTEAAAELQQLAAKISSTPDEQWRILDARDRILRGWGGAGARVKVGGATIGTCQDMCPEKELLHRLSEHQVMTLETMVDSEGQLDPARAVKQYSRSSADQEIPMCYELRPAPVLLRTCSYLLHEIADTARPISLADWFHFMWDRFRSIRKDIAQQALCCAESIRLVEMCARFHAHCAARLADLEHTQFDQKLNTDNLTKCLQTLKYMYSDVTADKRPMEAEFRGYIALLNLGDANFWWEIKHLPQEIQKSEPITFAIKVFNALDNNNYVRFFRLVREKATYLQACILLRYFNDVRARALARIVKAYAPRGQYVYPVADLMNALAFESVESMKAFVIHYGLRYESLGNNEPSIILGRNQFIEDSDPFPIARSINLIESKRQSSVGQVIAGGTLPNPDYRQHVLYSSFTKDGRLKENALVAEDQGFRTENDSNKDVKALKAEIQRLAQGGRSYANTEASVETARSINEGYKSNQIVVKPEMKDVTTKPKSIFNTPPTAVVGPKKLFSFKPAIPVASVDVIKNSPEKVFDVDAKSIFSFSKPQEPVGANLFTNNTAGVFTSTLKNSMEKKAGGDSTSLFDNKVSDSTKNTFAGDFSTPRNVPGVFQNKPDASAGNIFGNKSVAANVFENKSTTVSKNVFDTKSAADPKTVFGRTVAEKNDTFQNAQNVFKSTKPENSLFSKPDPATSIFGQNATKAAEKDVFANNPLVRESGLVLGDNQNKDNQATFNAKSIFASAKENSLFSKPDPSTKFETGANLFSKAIKESESTEAPKNIFAAFNKASESKTDTFKTNASPFDTPKNAQPTFAPNGDQSPGTFFKSVLNPPNGSDAKSYSIFQTKNKAQTVADNILNSISSTGNTVYDFNQNNEEQQNQLTLQRLQEEELKKEQERQLQLQREEELRQQELRRLEELRQEEIKRQNELRRQEELRRREEERKKQEEIRLMEEKRKREEQRKQEELRRRLEEERKAELKRKAEEEERKFREAVDKESTQLVEELVDEVNNETNRELLKEEQEKLRIIVKLATDTTESITTELCKEICHSELNAEIFLTYKIMKKWFYVWRQNLFRNLKRRRLLDDTPVWLPERTPIEEASFLRRNVESSALKNMNNIHRGYKFSGELKLPPPPEPYKLMDLIRSPLLKRMKEIQYPYDKCFFWKVTLVAPDEDKWLCKKINVQKWLIDAFSDKKQHAESETLIHVGKESWNHLMDFAISVSLINKNNMNNCVEAIEGTNGIVFYLTESDHNMVDTIELTLKHKYPYQIVPVAVIMPKMKNTSISNNIQNLLDRCVQNKIISGYKIFILESQNINELLHASTKKALKWVAKKYPQTPPLEIDHLKSICERYLGNEIWCRFRTERDSRMGDVLKDIQRLINCYNEAVERLTNVLTNDDLFNYASFPLEFNQYLDHASPYPKPYEFITSNVKTSENISTIRDILRQLKLPNPSSGFKPLDVMGMQNQIRTYCNQIGWFEDPEEVVCKVVAVIPNELTDMNMTHEDFTQYFAQYDLIDFLNIIVYEKIKGLNRFDNRFAIYEKVVLHEYRNMDWLYDVEALSQMKHKVIEYYDDIDCFIEAKRRKIALDSMEYLMLEDKDSTLVEENIKETDANITKYSHCSEAVEQLEKELEEGKKKAIEFENMLRAALADV